MKRMLVFERGKKGRRCVVFPRAEVEKVPEHLRRRTAPALPEVGELELIRHYMHLSSLNYSVDSGFYPLGSCTMKYNPKINERIAALPGFGGSHPLATEEDVQPILRLVWEMEEFLKKVCGMDAFTMQPSAGAHGELTGMLMIYSHHKARGERRTTVLIPDSAHGTNPATAAMCGYGVKQVKSNDRGMVDLEDLKGKMDQNVAALMLTNPNTLGVFEEEILEISRAVHEEGGLLYYDGANLNALLGKCRPGDMGFDVVHLNLHKSFSTPHGGGGPGAGPVGVRKELEPYLPIPVLIKDGDRFQMDEDRPSSIGKVSTFYGNIGVVIRAYGYIRMLGTEGLEKVAEVAVLNANYLFKKLRGHYRVPFPTQPMHELVVSASELKKKGVSALDVAKRLIDYGYHPPTMYFPLIVREALMIEPTETESLDGLDRFVEVMIQISEEAERAPDTLREAPRNAPMRRLNETKAAREPVLRWWPSTDASHT